MERSTLLIGVDGTSGAGKSTAAEQIARKLNTCLLDKQRNPNQKLKEWILGGDKYLFKFIEEMPKIMESIFDQASCGMAGLDYFLKHCFQSVDQYVELLQRAKPYIEQRVHAEIMDLVNSKTPPKAIVYDYATSSTMYPWVGDDTVERILVTAPKQTKINRVMNRNNLSSDHIPKILIEGQERLIKPNKANLVLHNDFATIEDFRMFAENEAGGIMI